MVDAYKMFEYISLLQTPPATCKEPTYLQNTQSFPRKSMIFFLIPKSLKSKTEC